MEDRQRLEQLAAEIQELQQRGEVITQQIEQLNATYQNLQVTEETIKGLEGSVGKEILIPLPAGCYVKAELKSEDVIVGLGANVAVGKTNEETLETIEKDKTEVQELINTLTEQLQKINKSIEDRRPEAEMLMQKTGVQ